MTTTTTTKEPTVAAARNAMLAFREAVVEAYGKGRTSELELGTVLLEAHEAGTAYYAATPKAERQLKAVHSDDALALSTEAASEAIGVAFGEGLSKQAAGKLRGFARVHGIAVTADIGTEGQRNSLTSGSCREVPAKATEAAVIAQLKKAMANGQRPTADALKAARPTPKGKGKGKGKGKTEDGKGKGKGTDTTPVIGIAEIRDGLKVAIAQAQEHGLKGSTAALQELHELMNEYTSVLTK